MRMENLPALFFGKQPSGLERHGGLRSLRTLPGTLQAQWLHRRLRAIAPVPKGVPTDLWEGQGTLLLYTTDPDAFALRSSVARVLRRFPEAILAVHPSQAPWWQAFFPQVAVKPVPSPSPKAGESQDGLESALPGLQGDWCWNLREDEDPFSRALTRVLGRSWRIGRGPSPWTNLSIEPPEGSSPYSGARVGTLARTFGWPEESPQPEHRGKLTALHVPSVPAKQLPRWQEAAQELVRSHQALVFQSGTVGGLGALECKPLPDASALRSLATSLARWVGPWDQHAGALASCGVEIVIVGRAPKDSVHRQVTLPRLGQAAGWGHGILQA